MKKVKNEKIVDRIKYFYEVVISKSRFEELRNFVSENCKVRFGTKEEHCGIIGMQKHIIATKSTYPNYKMTILKQYVDEDVVISEFIMDGVHDGEFLGIKPTHKKISICGVNIDKVKNDKIVEHAGAVNTFEALWDVGAIVANVSKDCCEK